MKSQSTQTESTRLSQLEKDRLKFAEVFHQDLNKRDRKRLSTKQFVGKYVALHTKMQEKIYQMLMDSLLKGFYRREFFIEQVQRIINESRQLKKSYPYYRGSVILLIDYDNFKKANDTHGHEFGDKVLIDVAKVVKKHIRRNSDILGREDKTGTGQLGSAAGRHGGDEVTALLFDTGVAGAEIVAERIQEEVDKLQIQAPDGSIWHQTISIGLSVILQTDKEAKEPIGRADAAAYQAKEQGKNKVVIWQESMAISEHI